METPVLFQTAAGVSFLAAGALLAAVIASRVGLLVARRLARTNAIASAVLEHAAEPARLLVCLAALQAVWHAAPDTLYPMVGLRHSTTILLIGAMTWLVVRIFDTANRVVVLLHPIDTQDNLRARAIHTQTRVLSRTLMLLAILFGIAAALMTFPSVRQIGTGLLASAGLAGLVIGFAAKPLLGNVLAGLQIALTQPIRLDDVVTIEGEFGRIEEITGSYVVVALWDERRLIVPLQWFIEHPIQNWTRTSSQILGAVLLWVDFGFPVEALRAQAKELCEQRPEWDRRVCSVQVTDASDRAMQLRILVSSASASLNWDLRCFVRERLIEFIRRDHGEYLPRLRTESREDNKPPEPVSAGR